MFSTHSPLASIRRNIVYCPKCADHIAVERYKPVVRKKQKKRKWTQEEIQLLDRVIQGELLTYQVAAKLKRTDRSVRRRLQRRMEEFEVKK